MNKVGSFPHISVLPLLLTLTGSLNAFQPGPDVRIMNFGSGSYIGLGVQEIDAARAKGLGLREERGVEVTRVAEGSPASKAGIKTEDVVLEYNGQRVEGVEQFMRMVRETPAGRDIRMSIFRSGGNQQITLTTAPRKSSSMNLELGPSMAPLHIPIPDFPRPHMSWRSSFLGIETEELDSQLAEYFGVKEGLLIRSVTKGSPADRAGVKAGDVIIRVDDTKVSSQRDITSAMRPNRSKKTIALQLVRDKREMPVQLAIED